MKNVLFAVLVLACSCGVSLKDKGTTQVELASQQSVVDYSLIPAKGPADAPVTVLEFTHFLSSSCAKVRETINQIEHYYGDCVRIEIHHFPLHRSDTMMAAEATMAAHAQGKFWEMVDKIFDNASTLEFSSYYAQEYLTRFAGEIGLNMDRYRDDVSSHRFLSLIEADIARGEELGVTGVPVFFINGEELVGVRPFKKFKEVINRHLADPSVPLRCRFIFD